MADHNPYLAAGLVTSYQAAGIWKNLSPYGMDSLEVFFKDFQSGVAITLARETDIHDLANWGRLCEQIEEALAKTFPSVAARFTILGRMLSASADWHELSSSKALGRQGIDDILKTVAGYPDLVASELEKKMGAAPHAVASNLNAAIAAGFIEIVGNYQNMGFAITELGRLRISKPEPVSVRIQEVIDFVTKTKLAPRIDRSEFFEFMTKAALGYALPDDYVRAALVFDLNDLGENRSGRDPGRFNPRYLNGNDIEDRNIRFRRGGHAPGLVIFAEIGFGEHLAFDFANRKGNEEPAVVRLKPGYVRSTNDLDIVAPNFATFLLECCKELVATRDIAHVETSHRMDVLLDEIGRQAVDEEAGTSAGGAVSEYDIETAERLLGHRLPQSYRMMIARFGWVATHSMELHGLDPVLRRPYLDEKMPADGIGYPDIVELNREDHRIPDRFVLFTSSGDGGYYALDMENTTDEEPIVAVIYPGVHDSEYEIRSGSFVDFLDDMVSPDLGDEAD